MLLAPAPRHSRDRVPVKPLWLRYFSPPLNTSRWAVMAARLAELHDTGRALQWEVTPPVTPMEQPASVPRIGIRRHSCAAVNFRVWTERLASYSSIMIMTCRRQNLLQQLAQLFHPSPYRTSVRRSTTNFNGRAMTTGMGLAFSDPSFWTMISSLVEMMLRRARSD
jgi:hypothetical protein